MKPDLQWGKDKKPDVTWRRERGELLVFCQSPKGAAWIAKHVTTNIHDTIRFEMAYGEALLCDMKESGLIVKKDK